MPTFSIYVLSTRVDDQETLRITIVRLNILGRRPHILVKRQAKTPHPSCPVLEPTFSSGCLNDEPTLAIVDIIALCGDFDAVNPLKAKPARPALQRNTIRR